MASISERANREIEAANASGTTPVVFVHGLWLPPSSWANWADFFTQAGYAPKTAVQGGTRMANVHLPPRGATNSIAVRSLARAAWASGTDRRDGAGADALLAEWRWTMSPPTRASSGAAPEGVPLGGGRRSAGVVRIGDAVHRPVRPWTPAVHAVLRHLELVGFPGAPRVVGFDEQGREVLTFLDGETVGERRPWPRWVDADATLGDVGAWLRRLHDA